MPVTRASDLPFAATTRWPWLSERQSKNAPNRVAAAIARKIAHGSPPATAPSPSLMPE
jgi:hypothetical protein